MHMAGSTCSPELDIYYVPSHVTLPEKRETRQN